MAITSVLDPVHSRLDWPYMVEGGAGADPVSPAHAHPDFPPADQAEVTRGLGMHELIPEGGDLKEGNHGTTPRLPQEQPSHLTGDVTANFS